MERLRRIIGIVVLGFLIAGGVGLVGMVLIVMANTISRLTPIGPIIGTFELSGYLGAVLVASALAHTQVKKGNIAIDILIAHFSQRTQTFLSTIIYFVSTVLCLVITWRLAMYATHLWQKHEVSPTLHLPFFYLIYFISLCFALLSIILATDFLDSVREGRQR
jgi:TRAP-type C4-dicarboxylate transport system permease small subunit